MSIFKNKLRLVFLGFLLVGLLVAIYPVFYHPEECPTGYTQQQIDSSNCIIGADIGSGLMFILGIAIAFISLYAIGLTYIWPKMKRFNNPFVRYLIFTGIAVAPFVIFMFLPFW